jgi:hypothetical protein
VNAKDCRDFAVQWVELANEVIIQSEQTNFHNVAQAWFNFADKIDRDQSFRSQVRNIAIFKPPWSQSTGAR